MHDEIREKIKSLQKKAWSTQEDLASKSGVSQAQISRFLRGKGTIQFDAACRLMEAIGMTVASFDEACPPQTREVCFVHADSTLGDAITPPKSVAEDYLAVPMASEPVAAGPGLFPADEIQGWVLVWRHHPSVRFKHNLVAVEVGKGERSMLPLFSPGDILLIDKDDRDPQPPGKAMLICEPDGACAVKRVSVTKDDGDYSVTFYSDNAKEFPPRSYKLGRDYEGDISRAIAGRVVWAWSDVRDK